MAQTRTNRTVQHQAEAAVRETMEEGKQVTHDIVEYVTEYARENPGTAALWCIGVGFVLGWKLKPW